jgi:hypothetical protein
LYSNCGGKPGLRVVLAADGENVSGVGAQMRLLYPDSKGPLREVHAGGGYWSQDDSVQVLGQRSRADSLWVRWPGGKVVTYALNDSASEIVARPSSKAEIR